jgi:hypothetical protein
MSLCRELKGAECCEGAEFIAAVVRKQFTTISYVENVHYTGAVRTEHQRSVTWVVLAVLLAQILAMTVHHVTHGSSASLFTSTDHVHHGHSDGDGIQKLVDQSSRCAFWLSLHCGASHVPAFAVALSVRPSALRVTPPVNNPAHRPHYLLTHLSSRGPPHLI